MSSSNKKDYDVGYRKPPRHTQFKPGQSGNPRGRPKKEQSFPAALDKALKAPVKVRENGKERVMSGFEACVTRLMTDAIQGKTSALKMILNYAEDRLPAEESNAPEEREDARKILMEKLDRIRERHQQITTPDDR